MSGEADNDTIYGGQGEDTIDGGFGDDHLFGNRGDDLLTGGSGSDVFYFGGEFGDDIVVDFDTAMDNAIVSGTVTDTTTNVLGTMFSFDNGSSILFEDVTLEPSDLTFI